MRRGGIQEGVRGFGEPSRAPPTARLGVPRAGRGAGHRCRRGTDPPGTHPVPAHKCVTFPTSSFGFCPSWERSPVRSVSQLFLPLCPPPALLPGSACPLRSRNLGDIPRERRRTLPPACGRERGALGSSRSCPGRAGLHWLLRPPVLAGSHQPGQYGGGRCSGLGLVGPGGVRRCHREQSPGAAGAKPALGGHRRTPAADPRHRRGATTERSPGAALTCGHRVPRAGLGLCRTLTGTKLFP